MSNRKSPEFHMNMFSLLHRLLLIYAVAAAGDHVNTDSMTGENSLTAAVGATVVAEEPETPSGMIPTSAALLGPWDLARRGRKPSPTARAPLPQPLQAATSPPRPTAPACSSTACTPTDRWEERFSSAVTRPYLENITQTELARVSPTNLPLDLRMSSTTVASYDYSEFTRSSTASEDEPAGAKLEEDAAWSANATGAPGRPPAAGLQQHTALVDGDILLGALLTVRGAGCARVGAAGVRAAAGLRAALAAAGAALRGARLRLGALLADDCGDDARALDMALHFIKGSAGQLGGCGAGGGAGDGGARRVWGVLGAAASRSAAHQASLLRLFRIPQVSWGARAAGLSNKARFEYFSRSTASDAAAARALAAVAGALGWTYVSVIYDDSQRGLEAVEALEAALAARGACVAARARVARGASAAAWAAALARLAARARARAVLLLADERAARAAAGAAARRGVRAAWLGGAGWWARARHAALHGALALAPRAAPPPALRRSLAALSPANYTDPWFLEYYEEKFKCSWEGRAAGLPACSGRQVVDLEPHPQLQYVADAVMAFAHAVKSLHAARCGPRPGLCDEMKAADGPELLKHLRAVRFTGMSGNEFYFDGNGDGPARFDVINLQRAADGELRWATVGSYDEAGLRINVSDIDWGLAGGAGGAAPTSVCAAACASGYAMRVARGERCCWRCERCGRHAVAATGRCVECPAGAEPDALRRRCEPAPALRVSPRQGAAAAALALAAAGLASCAALGALLWARRRSALLRAVGAPLALALLAAVGSAYALAALLVLPPSATVCAAQRFGAVVSFTAVYGALLLQTRREARRASGARGGEAAYAGGVLALAAAAAGAAAAWQAAAPARVEAALAGWRVTRTCAAPAAAPAAPALLLLGCALAALRARRRGGAASSRGAAGAVGAAVYASCVVWAAWLPLRAATAVPLRDASTAAAVALAATATLVCVFGPLVYILVCRPERNVWEDAGAGRERPERAAGGAGAGAGGPVPARADAASLTALHGGAGTGRPAPGAGELTLDPHALLRR